MINFLAELNCPKLQSPTNGWKSNATYFVDTTVNFGCNEGYELAGFSLLKCLPNRKWNGKAPICRGNHDRLCSAIHISPGNMREMFSISLLIKINMA